MEEKKEQEHEEHGGKQGMSAGPEQQDKAAAAQKKEGNDSASDHQDAMGQSQGARGIEGGMNAGGNGHAAGEQESAAPRNHQWAGQTVLPPGYAIDPVSGQVVFTGQAAPTYIYGSANPAQAQVYYGYAQQYPYQGETPEQAAARQAEAQQRHGQIVRSFEQFVEGDATVSDVVRTLYTNTADNEQLWKGVLVGAAATVLLTSKSTREALGKTFGSLFGTAKDKNKAPKE